MQSAPWPHPQAIGGRASTGFVLAAAWDAGIRFFDTAFVASVLLGTTEVSSLKRNLQSMETALDASIFAGFEPYAIC